MELLDVIHLRRSTRSFTSQPVEEEKLDKILKSINAAPSAGNMQAYEVYLVQNPELQKALSAASYNQEFLFQAPLVLVFCAHPARNRERYSTRGEKLYAIQDATIACTFAMLAAHSLDLGSVWVGAFNDEAVHKIIGAPPGQQPVAMLPIGYPSE
jgi:nitroreductase